MGAVFNRKLREVLSVGVGAQGHCSLLGPPWISALPLTHLPCPGRTSLHTASQTASDRLLPLGNSREDTNPGPVFFLQVSFFSHNSLLTQGICTQNSRYVCL